MRTLRIDSLHFPRYHTAVLTIAIMLYMTPLVFIYRKTASLYFLTTFLQLCFSVYWFHSWRKKYHRTNFNKIFEEIQAILTPHSLSQLWARYTYRIQSSPWLWAPTLQATVSLCTARKIKENQQPQAAQWSELTHIRAWRLWQSVPPVVWSDRSRALPSRPVSPTQTISALATHIYKHWLSTSDTISATVGQNLGDLGKNL